MSKHKYGMKKSVQNDLQQCINSFERMKRGGIGIADELVYDTCKRAMKYINALESKLAESEPVRHGEWFGTVCSACGEITSFYYDCDYCPRCGAKMEGWVDE